MKIAIKAEYEKAEVEALILDHHIDAFGPPPEGDKWALRNRYDSWVVTNEELPAPPETQEVMPPEPPKPATPEAETEPTATPQLEAE
jgi:hypothetical protein